MATKRKLNQRKKTDWETLIKTSLTNPGNFKWGCLNKQGKLFRISTLRSVQVPTNIINKMKRDGTIVLQTNDYYTYSPTKKRIRRTINS